MYKKSWGDFLNKSLDGIPEVFLKYCHQKDSPPDEFEKTNEGEGLKKDNGNYRDMLFMMLVFFIFCEDNPV